MAVNAASSLDGALRRGISANWLHIGALCLAVIVGLVSLHGFNGGIVIEVVFTIMVVVSAALYLGGTLWGKGMRSRSIMARFFPPIVGSALILIAPLLRIFSTTGGHVSQPLQADWSSVLLFGAALAWLADNIIEMLHDNDGTNTLIFCVYGGMVVCVTFIIRPDFGETPFWASLGILFFVGLPWFMGWFANRSKRVLLKNVREGIQALREGRAPEIMASSGGEARDIGEAVGTLMWAVRSSHEELRNKLMELEEQDKARREFLQNISHELRTPLMGVIGHADLLLAINAQKKKPEDVEKSLEMENEARFVRTIKEQGRRLLSMITDLLEYSRAESSQLKVFPKTFDIGGLLAEVGRSLRPYARRNQLEVIIETPESFVNADPAKMRQALVHVADNALKFTPKGGRVRLIARPAPEKGHIEVVIEDTGMGIPPEMLERLFKGFRQGNGSASREFGGLGIGLKLSRSLVEAHGGKMNVESKPGEGTRVTIKLRASVSPPRTPDIPDIIAGHLVLLFSPDRMLGELVRDQLRHTSLTVGLVFRREDLLDVIRKNVPRALLISTSSSDLNGGGLYESLETNPITASIPKILIADGIEGMEPVKGSEILEMPFDREQILGAIKRCLMTSTSKKKTPGIFRRVVQ